MYYFSSWLLPDETLTDCHEYFSSIRRARGHHSSSLRTECEDTTQVGLAATAIDDDADDDGWLGHTPTNIAMPSLASG